MSDLERYRIAGATANAIATSVEEGIRGGGLVPGERLPTVRALAEELGVSPMTVASAYRELRGRGLVATDGRRGTRVGVRPPLPTALPAPLPQGVSDLAAGNPDPALLPQLGPFLAALDPAPRLYGDPGKLSELVELAARDFARDGIPVGPVAVVGGALDGIERTLAAHLRP